MAIIIKCANCKARRQSDKGPCPACGSIEKRFVSDFRPDGRFGVRRRLELGPNIITLAQAKEIDQSTKTAIRERRQPKLTSDVAQYHILFDELIDDYMRDFRIRHRSAQNPERQEKSFRERENTLRLVAGKMDPVSIAMFDRHTAADYQRKRAEQITRTGGRVTNRTINKELTYVASYLKWARRTRKLDLKPFTFDRLPHRRPRPIVLSPDEVKRLVDAAEPFYRAFFLCLYTLGFRLSEARYLRVGDIDFEQKTVRAIQKGGSEKVEPLHPWLAGALKKIIRKKDTPDKYIFVNHKTGRPVGDIRRALERAAAAAKITKRITPHLLRHSIATHMLTKGINLRTIQVMLGHAQVGTTEWYTHVMTEDIRSATTGMFDDMRRKRSSEHTHR